MKIAYLLVFSLVALLTFYSCKSLKENPPQSAANKIQGTVFLDAGKCFGKCKAYQLKVHESGKAELNAIKNFENLGTSTFDVSDEKLEEMSRLIDKAQFMELDSEYLSGARDLQVFEITYQSKAVRFHKMKAPQELLDVLGFLQALAEEKGR